MERVNIATCGVGVGGDWDPINVVELVVVASIASLEVDHVAVLGDMIGRTAWHKSGIFKKDCPAFSVQQVGAATDVLEQLAVEKQASLQLIDIHP